jgi:hypothetical protein
MNILHEISNTGNYQGVVYANIIPKELSYRARGYWLRAGPNILQASKPQISRSPWHRYTSNNAIVANANRSQSEFLLRIKKCTSKVDWVEDELFYDLSVDVALDFFENIGVHRNHHCGRNPSIGC